MMKQTVFVNKFVKKNSGRISMHTWFEDAPHAGYWECDAYDLKSGEARNEDWLTMDENLKACYEHFKEVKIDELPNQIPFKVKIEFDLDEEDNIINVKLVDKGF